MYARPLISVIMPIFNACRANPHYLVEALESVANQTYKNFELIIVDDGSTDQSSDICKKFIQNNLNENIFYYFKENRGQSNARNYGARKAKGDYLCFIDQDDIWKENKLELIIPHLDADTNFVYTDSDSIKEDGSIMFSNIHRNYLCGAPHPKNSIEDILFKDIYVMPGLMTIKKKTFFEVDGFDERLSGYEDDDLFLRIYEVSNIKYLPVSTFKWRIYDNNYSFSDRMIKSRLYYWEKLLKNYTNQGKDSRRIRKISYRFFREFISQAVVQYRKNDKLYFQSLIGAKKILEKITLHKKIIFKIIFLLKDRNAIKFMNWLYLRYSQLRLHLHSREAIVGIFLKIQNYYFPLISHKLNREIIARMYINGKGIEIGALNDPLKIPKKSKVKYVDRFSASDLMKQYLLKESDIVNVDIIDDGEKLETIEDSSLDFVIANNFLEHCQNPILAIRNMLRVLKDEGIIFLSIPDKNYTFDRDRSITNFEHILKDYEEGPEWSKTNHFKEWVTYVDRINEEKDAEKHISFLMDVNYSIHFHVWTQTEMIDFILTLKKIIGIKFSIEIIFKNRQEVIFILKKDSLIR